MGARIRVNFNLTYNYQVQVFNDSVCVAVCCFIPFVTYYLRIIAKKRDSILKLSYNVGYQKGLRNPQSSSMTLCTCLGFSLFFKYIYFQMLKFEFSWQE